MKKIDKDSKIIRMVYVAFEKYYNEYSSDINNANIGQTCFWSKQFQLPEGMTLSDACKIISYLSEKVEKENSFEEGSKKSVMKVSSILEDYGFSAIEGTEGGNEHGHGEYRYLEKNKCFCEKAEGVVDLITYAGQERQFKRSDIYSRYFDWFTEGVKEDEIKQILSSNNIDDEDERTL